MSKFHSKEVIHPTELALRVMDLDKSEDFYRSIMGFKTLLREDKKISLTADGKRPIITLISPDNIRPKTPRRTGLYHVAILLPDPIQLGLFLKHIREKNYPLIGASNHGVSQALYLEDIDGNGIEVYADIDSESWTRVDDSIEMVTLPLDYEKLIGDTGDLEWEAIPKETIIGHIHLHVADLDKAKEFYIEGLGMDLIAEMRKSAVFTSSGGYHHHIAFNIWNGRESPALERDRAGMDYYLLKFPNQEILSEKVKNLQALGYDTFEKEGAIFVEDPSKNQICLSL